jgi:hypothetical protein
MQERGEQDEGEAVHRGRCLAPKIARLQAASRDKAG